MALAISRLSPARLIAGAATVDGSLALTNRLIRVSWLGLIVAALVEAVAIIAVATAGKKNTSALDRLTDNWLFVAGLTVLLLSLTVRALARLWVREANEAFRYTCSLGGFDPLTRPDGELLPSLSEQLRHDVGRRLSERISRLTFLAPELADAQIVEGRVPHLHVCGHFLIRQNVDGSETLEVVPRARIGKVEAGESIAVPAEIKLEQSPRWVRVGGVPLDPDIYERIVESVYFSLATEIYRQIRVDVSRKIDLLPTRHLRATAYLVEAEDYARSNTLDAHEAATDLFLRSMTLYDRRWAPLSSSGARRAGQRLTRASTGLRVWIGERAARVFHRPGKRVVLIARAEIGYARTLLSRRALSGLSGHRVTPIFLTLPVAKRAVKRLKHVLDEAENALDARFEAHVVLASAWSEFGRMERAVHELEHARGLLPLEADEHPAYVLARATTEKRLRSALPLLRRAAELDPRSEVAQFELARHTELFWRTRSSLERSVASHAVEEYRRVLRINPSNVRAWTNIGTVHWLLEDADDAETAYRRARRLKDTVADIYVADVDFGLARIAAERMDVEAAYRHYIQGMAARISQGFTRVGDDSELLELLNSSAVERFRRYHAKVLAGLDELDRKSEAAPTHRLRQSVRAFVSNDLGLAVYSLLQRTGEDRLAAEADHHFKAARRANPDFVLPHYNNALLDVDHKGPRKAQRHRDRLEALEPGWREGQMIGYLIDVRRANDLEKEAASLEQKLADVQQFGERLSPPTAATPGRQLEAEAPTRLASERDLRPVYTQRLWDLVNQHRQDAEALRDKVSREIIALFPARGLESWPWRDGDFDWRVLEDRRIRKREERELRWEREFDDFLVLALGIWLLGKASAYSLPPEEGVRLAKLVEHLIARFPDDVLYSLRTMLAAAIPDETKKAAVVVAEREHHVEALERDPVEFKHLRWLVREEPDLPKDERRTLLEYAAAIAEMSESRRLVAEGFWSIGEYGHALDNLRSAALFETDERHKAILYTAYQLRAAVYQSSIGSATHGVNELRILEEQRPPDRSDRWRHQTVADIAQSAIANVAPEDRAPGVRAQRMLSLWLGAEQRRVAANASEDDRADLAWAQAEAATVTTVGGLALPLTAPDEGGLERLLPVVAPIGLICEESLFPSAELGAEAERMLQQELPRVRDLVLRATGVAPPGVNIQLDGSFAPGEYRIFLDQTPAEGGVAMSGMKFCFDAAACAAAGVTGTPAVHPDGARDGMWVTADALERALHAGIPSYDAYDFMGAHLQAVLIRNAWRFFGVDEAAKLVATLEEQGEDEDLVNQFIRKGRTDSLVLMSGVVQALLWDGVRVDLKSVLEVVAARGGHDSVGVLTERARFALRRGVPGTAEPGSLVELTDAFEQAVSRRVERFSGVGALSMPEAELQQLLDLMEPHLEGDPRRTTVVVRMAGLRPHLHELVSLRWPDVRVLSAPELLDQWWTPAAIVSLASEVGELAG